MFARSSRLYPAAAAAGTGDSGCEQRMESGKYAVITLFFAVLQIAENSCSSRKRLKMLEVRRNYPSFAASNSKTYAVNYAVLVGVINNFVRNSQIGFVQENG